MCLAPPKAAPVAFLEESGGLRKRGKATLAAARAAAVAVASAPSADAESFDVDVKVDVKVDASSQQQHKQPKETSPSLFNDLLCLKTMWFQKASGDTHEERLSSFYAPQADAYDAFRSRFLWARKPMLAAAAARLSGGTLPPPRSLVWIDSGGGTGENVRMMTDNYLPLECFAAIYVVDLAKPLCEQAQRKVGTLHGWKGTVHVVHGDATTFVPPSSGLGSADLVTFSYSLSMMPPFLDAVDHAAALLKPGTGIIGVADFYAAAKHDHPHRSMSWARRFFWQAVFDTDGISIGPERRAALDHRFERLWEENGEGGIPYVPYLRVPWYAWVGRAEREGGVIISSSSSGPTAAAAAAADANAGAGGAIHALQQRHVEPAPEAPSAFPPTFLYTMSWEDPRADEDILRLAPGCRLLTLTSGGDNSLTALLSGAALVVSVDVNPAQSALLELKAAALRAPAHAVSYDDIWKLFGEGRHERAPQIYERALAPLMSQSARSFWSPPRLSSCFDPRRSRGLYFQGGMGKLVAAIHVGAKLLGLGRWLEEMADAPTLEAQVQVWESAWPVRFFSLAPTSLVDLLSSVLAFTLFNRLVLWFGAGVPCAQYEMIERDDGVRLSAYAARTLRGVATRTHLRGDNYFYASCLRGKYLSPDEGGCCPQWMTREGVALLRSVDGEAETAREEGRDALAPAATEAPSSLSHRAPRVLGRTSSGSGPSGPRSPLRVIDRLEVRSCTFLDALRSGDVFDRVILMDHCDWCDEKYARELAEALAAAVPRGGRVIWRSASLRPWYSPIIAAAGFEVSRVSGADTAEGGFMDRVNMYASFWVGRRK